MYSITHQMQSSMNISEEALWPPVATYLRLLPSFPFEARACLLGLYALWARGLTLVSYLHYILIGLMTIPALYNHPGNLKGKFMKNIRTVSGVWSVQ